MVAFTSHDTSATPTLRTLGTLHLVGSQVTRPKPLLLLAYLAHEGPTDRERLARLFFVASRDPRDALSTTLRRLGSLVDRPTTPDGRLRTSVTTDALAFQHCAALVEPQDALDRYGGAFLQGSAVGCSVELEEWIVSTRERLGSIARSLHVRLALTELDREKSQAAWNHVKAAVDLTENFALEPEPTGEVLQRFVDAGLPVPEGWWRAIAALGFDRPRRLSRGGPVERSHTRGDGARRRRNARRGLGAPRDTGQRKPRRLTERP